jgi:hypothetical protein
MAKFWFSFRLQGGDDDRRRADLYDAAAEIASSNVKFGLRSLLQSEAADSRPKAWFDPTSFGLLESAHDLYFVAGTLAAGLDDKHDVLILRRLDQGPTLVFGTPENFGDLLAVLGDEYEELVI